MKTAAQVKAEKVKKDQTYHGNLPPVANRLKEKRLEFGIAISDVAPAIGSHAPQVSRWESGENIPRIGWALKLAQFYETTVEELFYIEEKSND